MCSLEAELRTLVERATCHKKLGEEVGWRDIQMVKRVGKQSNKNIKLLYALLLQRLHANNSQVRICCLELWRILFERSELFRQLACMKFDDFLDLVTGYRSKGRLPDPKESAKELQRQGILLLQSWHEKYSIKYPRIALALRHLKGLPFISFPEVSPSQSHRIEGGEFRSIIQQGLDDNGMGDRQEHRQSGRSRMQDQNHLLDAVERFQTNRSHYRSLSKQIENIRSMIGGYNNSNNDTMVARDGANANEEMEWEDVDDVGNVKKEKTFDSDVIRSMFESYSEASSKCIPELQSIISVCAVYHEEQEAQATLRDAVLLNSSLSAACVALERDLGKSFFDSQSHPARFNPPKIDKHKLNEARHKSNRTSPLVKPPIRDPTVAQRTPRTEISHEMGHQHHSGRNEKGETVRKTDTSTEKGQVLKKLAQVAPVVPFGAYTRVWDSDGPPVYASSHSMEVSNHWGPVDAHQQLPKDRMEDLFLVDQAQIVYKQGSEDHSAPPKYSVSSPTNASNKSGREMPLYLEESILQHGIGGKEKRQAERRYNDLVLSQSLGISEADDFVDKAPKRVKLSALQRLAKKLRLGHNL
eukprot:jgi/Picsp_1/3331/NSC_06170-R1_protein